MVIDTSAIVASLADEPDAARFREALKAAAHCTISAFNALECRVVLGPGGARR
jgi:uncharacterized protein with PIN domain